MYDKIQTARATVTIVRVGTNKKYSQNWESVFGNAKTAKAPAKSAEAAKKTDAPEKKTSKPKAASKKAAPSKKKKK